MFYIYFYSYTAVNLYEPRNNFDARPKYYLHNEVSPAPEVVKKSRFRIPEYARPLEDYDLPVDELLWLDDKMRLIPETDRTKFELLLEHRRNKFISSGRMTTMMRYLVHNSSRKRKSNTRTFISMLVCIFSHFFLFMPSCTSVFWTVFLVCWKIFFNWY